MVRCSGAAGCSDANNLCWGFVFIEGIGQDLQHTFSRDDGHLVSNRHRLDLASDPGAGMGLGIN